MSATNNTTTSRGTLGKVFAGAVGAAVGLVTANGMLTAEAAVFVVVTAAGVTIPPVALAVALIPGIVGAVAVGAKVGLMTYRGMRDTFNAARADRRNPPPLPFESGRAYKSGGITLNN